MWVLINPWLGLKRHNKSAFWCFLPLLILLILSPSVCSPEETSMSSGEPQLAGEPKVPVAVAWFITKPATAAKLCPKKQHKKSKPPQIISLHFAGVLRSTTDDGFHGSTIILYSGPGPTSKGVFFGLNATGCSKNGFREWIEQTTQAASSGVQKVTISRSRQRLNT